MSETRLRFMNGFPDALKEETEALIRPLLFIVPELRTLQIALGTEDNQEAQLLVLRRYHTAQLALGISFFDSSFEEREITILHEFMHVKADIYVREVMHAIKEWVPEEVFTYVYDRLEDAEDTLVDDLAYVMREALTPPEKMPKLRHPMDEEDTRETLTR